MRAAMVSKGIEPILGYVDHYPPDTNGYAVLLSGATLAALAIRPEDAPRRRVPGDSASSKTRGLARPGRQGRRHLRGPDVWDVPAGSPSRCAFDARNSPPGSSTACSTHPYLATMPRYCLGLLAPDTKQIPCFSDGSPGVAVPKLMMILAHRGSQEAAYYLQLIGYLAQGRLRHLRLHPLRREQARPAAARPGTPPRSSWTSATRRCGTASTRGAVAVLQVRADHQRHRPQPLRPQRLRAQLRRQWLDARPGLPRLLCARPAQVQPGQHRPLHAWCWMWTRPGCRTRPCPRPGHDQVNLAGGRDHRVLRRRGSSTTSRARRPRPTTPARLRSSTASTGASSM